MKTLYLLSAVLVAQVFCVMGENCSAHIEDISEQSRFGKDILELCGNKD